MENTIMNSPLGGRKLIILGIQTANNFLPSKLVTASAYPASLASERQKTNLRSIISQACLPGTQIVSSKG